MKLYKTKKHLLYPVTSLFFVMFPSQKTLAGDASNLADVEEEIIGTFWQIFFKIYDMLSFLYPFVIIGSFCISTILIIIFHKDKRIRKLATILGCIIIPIISTFLVYAMPYIYLAVNGK